MTAPVSLAQAVAWLSPSKVEGQRWFRHKGRIRGGFEAVDGWPIMRGGSLYGWWLVVKVPVEGEAALYQVPVVLADEPASDQVRLGECVSEGRARTLVDGASDALVLGDPIARVREGKGAVRAERFGAPISPPALVESVHQDSSNTLCRLDGTLLFKLYRCLDAAGRREADLLAALARQNTEGIPEVRAVVGYEGANGEKWALALVQEWVSHGVNAWDRLTRTLARGPGVDTDIDIRSMAKSVAAVHRGLMAVGAREWTEDDTSALKARIGKQIARLRETEEAKASPQLASDLEAALERTNALPITEGGVVCPVHGDLHLGQLLYQHGRYLVLDFEGEPLASPEARLAWHSPLKDVAGMLRSFDYAAAMARRQGAPGSRDDWERWVNRAEETFLDAYARNLHVHGAPPTAARDIAHPLGDHAGLLSLYLLEKATYEIAYELQSRPDWLDIPQHGLRRVLSRIGVRM